MPGTGCLHILHINLTSRDVPTFESGYSRITYISTTHTHQSKSDTLLVHCIASHNLIMLGRHQTYPSLSQLLGDTAT